MSIRLQRRARDRSLRAGGNKGARLFAEHSSYIGTCVPVRDLPRHIALYRQGRMPVDRLLTGRWRLDEINLGFDRPREGKAVRQVVVF